MKKLIYSIMLTLTTASGFSGSVKLSKDAFPAELAAAKDLQEYFQKVTGKSIEETPYTFYLGKAASEATWFKAVPLAFEEWHIISNGNELVITGDVRGTVWGVYEFIEKYLGCRFYANDTEVVPENPNWSLPGINERHRPPFFRREMSSGNPRLNTRLFRMRRKESVRTSYPEIRMHHGSPQGCHTFACYVKDWPENGPFAAGSKNEPCYSKPEARKLFAEKLRFFIEEDRKDQPRENWPILYSVDQNDGYGNNCKCGECRKFPSISDANIDFVNAIAEDIEKDYPEILVQTFAYQHTQPPPQSVKARQNVLVRSCNSEITAALLPGSEQGKILEGWKPMADKLAIWSYWKPYSGEETPYLKPRKVMQAEIQYCRDVGVLTYYAENENPYVRSFYALQYYLWSKLTIDPDCDIEALTDDFLAAYYGKAAPFIRQYLEYLEKRMHELPYRIRGNTYVFLDWDFFTQADTLLDAAEKAAAGDERSLKHVQWERIPVDHARLMRQDKLPLGDGKTALIQRWRRNAEMVLNEFVTDWNWRKESLGQRILELDNEVKLFEAMPFEIPAQFQNLTIHDLHWPDFNPWGVHHRYLVDDPEASSGRAFTLRKDRPTDPAKHNRKEYHMLPISIGLYDSSAPKDQQYAAQYYWERGDYAADEKYHWYKLGETAITKDLRIYVHWSWNLSIYMRKAITGIDQNFPKEVWASIKITGPAYVEGSEKPNGIFIDRVILVEK
ncbi:MAG: DUF4838 domain-containing protein [Lentisphaeria bacterium]